MDKDDEKIDRREWSKAPAQAGEPKVGAVDGAGSDLTKTPRVPKPWVNSAVWTPPMLDALRKGVKGGKWFSLMDKVYSEKNLRGSFDAVARNKGAAGSDHQTIGMW